MVLNGVMNMCENNKLIIFDYAQNVSKDPCVVSVYITCDDEKDDEKIVDLLTNNGFKINGCKFTEFNNINNDIFNDDPIVLLQQTEDLAAIFTISLDTYNFADDFNINIYFVSDIDNTAEYKLYFQTPINNQIKIYNNVATAIGNNMESFMLLRTNPKLTGNIKLIVSNDHLYLDTFKVSQTTILNNKQYRHRAISADGNYPYDVYKVFKDVPQGELYSVYEDSYKPHKHYFSIDQQIENIYEYGAEYNTDNLYSENMRILAPLYIGKHLPTYFAIFKSDRLKTTDETTTNSEIFRSLLVESQCIKIYDLRKHTAIGKYLNNYQQMITKYFASACSLQFIEQEFDSTDENHRQGQNTWSGIAVNKGILTDKTETTYFGTQILNNSKKPQEDFNMFILNGYSRNMLLYPNILNLEFMFDDDLADDLTMHNYFGLYLTENEFIHFNQIIKTYSSDGNYKLNYFDSDNKLININETPIHVIEDQEYADRIFFASTLNNATYLAIRDDFDLFVKNSVANKASKNIVQIPGTKVKFDETHKSFITLNFTKQIKYGEHFKFIAPDVQYKDDKYNVTIELIASNDTRLAKTAHCVNSYVLTNNSERAFNDGRDDKNRLYRITFYTQDLTDSTQAAPLEEQLERFRYAIQKVNNHLIVSHYDDSTIGLISSQESVYFQHILADEIKDDQIEDPVRYFNYNIVTNATTISNFPDLYRTDDIPFENSGFEILGDRYSNITKFIKIANTSYVFYEVQQDLYEQLHNIKYPLIATVEGYQPMITFKVNNGNAVTDISTFDGSELSFADSTISFVTSPWNVKNSLIASPYEVSSPNGFINISEPMPCSVSLMGINNIKDIDTYVDINEYKEYSTGITATFTAGEIVKIDNSDPRLKKYVPYTIISGSIKGISTNSINSFVITEDSLFYSTGKDVVKNVLQNDYIEFNADTTIALVDTNNIDLYDYQTYRPILQESNYYINPSDTENGDLEIPLVPAVNCQWKSNGEYFDNNSLLDVYELFNHVVKGNFIQNVYTPSGLYNNQYIINKFKDYINYNGNITTIEDFLKNSKYANAFKKFLVSSFKIDTAIANYNAYVQTLEFIYYGIKFSFKLANTNYANEIKLNEYNNYEVLILNDYTSSETNEIYISTIEEFILIINHTYKSGIAYSNNNIQVFNNDKITNAQYDWYSAAYNYLLQKSGIINNTLYLNKSEFYQLYDSDNIQYIIEYDLPIYDSAECDISETTVYSYFNTSHYFESFTKTDILYPHLQDDVFEYDFTFNNKLSNDAINEMITTYADSIQDYRQKNTYVIKNNDNSEQSEKTYADVLNEFIESFSANMTLTIISTNETTTININDNYKPITLNISTPIRVKYNQGFFSPFFVDIFTFVINDDISDTIDLDTLYANTQVTYIASLRNYYYNKILNTNKDCIYNYFRVDYRSIFTTNWDENVYRLYDDDTTYSAAPGYQIGIDDKMMFGSKVLAVHNDGIKLTDWFNPSVSIVSSTHNEDSTTEEKLQIKLNITKNFYNYIISSSFINNWNTIKNQLNINTYINNYINNTLSNIYNFRNNFDVILYKLYAPQISASDPYNYFISSTPDNLDDFEVTNNIKTIIENINNEVIITITVSNYNKYKYFPIIKINKI